MQPIPLRTTVIGSYPFPAWLEFASQHLEEFGRDDLAELQDDAVVVAIHDQLAAGLDVITDGEQTRLDFNLSFYGYLAGIELESASPRRFGPPAHDQRGRHAITGTLAALRRLGGRRGISSAAAVRACRCHAQGQRARAVHHERSIAAQRAIPRSVRHHRSAACR